MPQALIPNPGLTTITIRDEIIQATSQVRREMAERYQVEF